MKRIVFVSVLAAFGSASALAADMAPRMPVKAAPMMAPVSSWQGFYVGGNIGYGWGQGEATTSALPVVLEANSLNAKPQGVIGGGQVGYNWQIGSLLTGLEADIQGSGIKGTTTKAPFTAPVGILVLGSSLPVSEEISWFGTVRGRLGVIATPTLLFYATGGLAYGHVNDSTNVRFPAVEVPATVSKIKTGWTAGAGAEWMFAHNWSAKLEYLYVDLGTQSATASTASFLGPGTHLDYTWKNQDHMVRAGVNYHF